jgi:hypothetical protein
MTGPCDSIGAACYLEGGYRAPSWWSELNVSDCLRARRGRRGFAAKIKGGPFSNHLLIEWNPLRVHLFTQAGFNPHTRTLHP